MSIKVDEIMTKSVVTTTAHKTVAHAKELLESHHFNILPIVDNEMHAIGMVSSSDLLKCPSDSIHLAQIMQQEVHTIAQYSDVEVAARIMRKQKIHHLVVTHEKKVVGIISSFDLLRMIENKRFVMKNPSTPKKQSKKAKLSAQL